MSVPLIEIDQLGKRYEITAQRTIHHNLQRLIRGWFGRPSTGPATDEFWALKDVSFNVDHGEVLGVIGSNGAGKSTLLKILSRITAPTEGQVRMRGRVSSLLEVGTGFHPELTGRENMYLNASILGMSRAEINSKFDQIVAFAEIEQFLDTPVKWYSSGMHVRLAFAVAAHLDPDILICDEVLAVGDAAFQRKCLGQMSNAARSGRTVLMVSHNMSAVRSLCQRAILIDEGRLVFDGPTEEAVHQYLGRTGIVTDQACGQVDFSNSKDPADGRVRLWSMKVIGSAGGVRSTFSSDESINVELSFSLSESIENLKLGFQVRAADGTLIFMSFTNDADDALPRRVDPEARYLLRTTIPANLMNHGLYRIDPAVGISRRCWLFENLAGPTVQIVFDVPNRDTVIQARRGMLAPILKWNLVVGSI